MSRKLLFIVNPKAGHKLGKDFVPEIRRGLSGVVDHEVMIWEQAERFDLVRGALTAGNFTEAVAVGGDGTVNKVASTALELGLKLGILPAGSGNGLARSLGYPMEVKKALRVIAAGKTARIDTGEINGKPFFCTSGLGFDAHVGHLFASSQTRGLKTYIKIIRREFRSYQPENYRIRFDGKEIERKAFLITIGNASQYGNDFHIVPGALMNDGLFHVSILKPFRLYQVPGLLIRVLRKKANESSLVETFSAAAITIERKSDAYIHFDGEPALSGPEVRVIMRPSSLEAIVGPAFRG